MMVRTFAASAVFAAFMATLAAQGTPDFSGTWTVDRARTAALSSAPAGGGAGGGLGSGGASATAGARAGGATMGGGGSQEWVITQTPAALTITRVLPDGTSQKLLYKLDGSESVNVNGRTTQKTRSTISGGQLTTTGTQTVSTGQGDVTSSMKEVRSLDAHGSMVVELTRTVEGSGSRTTTTVYSKKK